MRRALPLLMLLAGCAPAGGTAGGGIVSLNPCADQLLLALVPRERIAAISHYSRDPAATSIPLHVARALPVTAGTAEEVIALKPDLVLASSFTPAATRAAFKRAGLPILYLASPTTIAASREQVREVAAALGASDKGAVLIRDMDTAPSQPHRDMPPVSALLYIAGDLANGRGTLLDDMMTRAGLRNAAADYGMAMTGTLPVETILSHPPSLILTPDAGGRTATIRRRLLNRSHAKVREAAFPSAFVNCGGPTIPIAMARLTAIRQQMAP